MNFNFDFSKLGLSLQAIIVSLIFLTPIYYVIMFFYYREFFYYHDLSICILVSYCLAIGSLCAYMFPSLVLLSMTKKKETIKLEELVAYAALYDITFTLFLGLMLMETRDRTTLIVFYVLSPILISLLNPIVNLIMKRITGFFKKKVTQLEIKFPDN